MCSPKTTAYHRNERRTNIVFFIIVIIAVLCVDVCVWRMDAMEENLKWKVWKNIYIRTIVAPYRHPLDMNENNKIMLQCGFGIHTHSHTQGVMDAHHLSAHSEEWTDVSLDVWWVHWEFATAIRAKIKIVESDVRLEWGRKILKYRKERNVMVSAYDIRLNVISLEVDAGIA